MKKIEKLGWEEINNRVGNMSPLDATKTVFYEVIEKINQLIDTHNQQLITKVKRYKVCNKCGCKHPAI